MKKDTKIPLSVLRSVKGLSQKDLANRLNVSPSSIALYETGKRKPKLDRAIEIAKIFDVSVESIAFKSEVDQHKENDETRNIYRKRCGR